MNTNSSILSLQHSNQISIDSYKDGKKLKSLWLSIPAYCHLSCPYCFASTNAPGRKIEILSNEQYEKIIRDFAALGGEFIGIPGDGEPFHPSNWNLIQFILTLCDELKIKVALFTTGDLIFFGVNGKENEPDYKKIEFIKDKDVVLLIKYNHSNELIQNKLVGGKHANYTRLREKALDILIDQYHLNDVNKLGLVTSVMRENAEKEEPNGKLEIINIYERTKRQNLIFDCDTILELGRGKTFTACDNGVLPQVDLEKVFKKLTDAGAIGLNQGGTYVGNTCCDRILHHLYIKSNGDVFPCIGCSREDLCEKMKLGNIEKITLDKLWQKPLRRKLAEKRHETLIGVCANCENFKTEKCYSCLGRCIISEECGNPIDSEGTITTIGCLHHKPSTTTWLANLVDYIRTTLSYKITTDSLKDINVGLEQLWRPNKNIAFTLCQLTLDERIKEIKNLIDFVGNPHDDNNYRPYYSIQNSKIADFSQKKHFRFSDLQFPMNKVWDFVKDPEEHFIPKEKFGDISDENKQKVIKTISQSFLSNVFLSSFKILFDKYDSKEENIVYCNFILYDNIKEKYFYRSIAKGSENINEKFEIVISRWYEDLLINSSTENPWKEKCHNLSASLRHELYGDYELKLKRKNNGIEDDPDLLQRTIDLSDILNISEIKLKVNEFRKFLNSPEFDESYSIVGDFINTKIFKELNAEDSNKIKDFYTVVNNVAYFNYSEENSIADKLLIEILHIFNNLEKKLLKQKRDVVIIQKLKEELYRVKAEGNGWKFVNYFVYLGIMHDILNVNYYYLLHSTNFATINPEQKELLADKSVKDIIKSSGILICTKRPIRHDFRAELKLFLSNLMAPFDEFYFYQIWAQGKAGKEFNEKVKAHRHSILNIRKAFNYVLKEISSSKYDDIDKENFQLSLDKLQVVYEVYNIAVLSGITEKSEMPSYFGKTIPNLLDKVCLYCKIAYTSLELKYFKAENSPNLPSTIDAFTVIFNLFINAAQTMAYSSRIKEIDFYEIKTYLKNDFYYIEVRNPAIIDNRCRNFINETSIDLEKFPYNELIKEWGGLSISKRLCKKLGWFLSVKIENNWTVFIIEINIAKYGK